MRRTFYLWTTVDVVDVKSYNKVVGSTPPSVLCMWHIIYI